MGGHPFPEIPRTICAKLVDLTVDLYADEHGTAVHEDCYVNRVVVLYTTARQARYEFPP
jgi:hypothetical protein